MFLSSRQNGRIFQPNAVGCDGAGWLAFGASSETASVPGFRRRPAGGRHPQKRPSSQREPDAIDVGRGLHVFALRFSAIRRARARRIPAARARRIPGPRQRWFWTERWQEREREVDAHVEAGEVQVHDSPEDFIAHLDELMSE